MSDHLHRVRTAMKIHTLKTCEPLHLTIARTKLERDSLENVCAVLVGTENRELWWICSQCGVSDRWGPQWKWFGAAECARCRRSAIEWVSCSPACAKQFTDAPDAHLVAKTF